MLRRSSRDPVNLVNGALPLKPGTNERARAAFGTSGFNSMRGPWHQQLGHGHPQNFTLYKETKFTFRAEFFNIWNQHAVR